MLLQTRHGPSGMDAFHLLTRSSRRPRKSGNSTTKHEDFKDGVSTRTQPATSGIKRKRHHEYGDSHQGAGAPLNFFGRGALDHEGGNQSDVQLPSSIPDLADGATVPTPTTVMDENQRRAILKRHKLKITVLDAGGLDVESEESRKKRPPKTGQALSHDCSSHPTRYPEPLQHFNLLTARYNLPRTLGQNIIEQGYQVPTEVQMAGIPLLMHDSQETDLLSVAPTGSGKTLAFLIPLIHRLYKKKNDQGPKAIILAPTKELAHQLTNEGRKLAARTGIRFTCVKKGMHLSDTQIESDHPVGIVKSDVLVSTPLTLSHALEDSASPLDKIGHLILDEADVLLDPLFRDQTLSIWNALTSHQLHVSLWSATMGSNIEDLVRDIMSRRLSALKEPGRAPRPPLIRLVVGLKDSAVPNIEHRLTFAATEQGKLMALRQSIHPTGVPDPKHPPLRAPFLVFVQTIERATALHAELKYDIPVEAGGSARIAVLHSKLSDTTRDKIMAGFRSGEIWVLITTDLLSRGVDFRGVNAVVNYDVPTSSAAYVHRVGRTGRSGRAGGVALTLYTKEDVPYIKTVVNVIAASQKQRVNGAEVQQWLLDALPSVSKADKKMLKKRGVEARRSVAPSADVASGATASKRGNAKTRISTRTGYDRRVENNRKAAIQLSRTRPAGYTERSDDDDDDDDDDDE